MGTRAQPPPSPVHARQAVLATAAYQQAGGHLRPDTYIGANGQVSQEPGWWDTWGRQVIPLLGLGLGTWAMQALQNHVVGATVPAGDFTPSPSQGQGEAGTAGMTDALPLATAFSPEQGSGSYAGLVPLQYLMRGMR